MTQPTVRQIIHADLDAFYAAVEQLDNPELRGRPVLVGGRPDGRGVVATASYEARKFGVHSAMPMATAVRHCPEGIIIRPRFDRYREMSAQVMGNILRRYRHCPARFPGRSVPGHYPGRCGAAAHCHCH